MMKDPNVYPPGWNAKKVQEIIDYYENQTNEDAATEIERVHSGYAMVEVPKELPEEPAPKTRKPARKTEKTPA